MRASIDCPLPREAEALHATPPAVPSTPTSGERFVDDGAPRIKRFLRALVPSAISACVHAVALWLLTLSYMSIPPRADEIRIVAAAEAVIESEAPPLETRFEMARPSDQPQESVFSSTALAMAPVQIDEAELLSVAEPATSFSTEFAPEPLETLAAIVENDLILRTGSAGEEVEHVEGAVDRLTHEIVTNLESDDVLVVWLMDASISLVKDRQAVADRMARVYREIGQLDGYAKGSLLSAVIGFGQGAEDLAAPTADGAKVVEAIRNVQTDPSGIENVFSTVVYAVDKFKVLRTRERRRLMVIIWTDESGDDYNRLEEAVDICRRLSVPVYTVGSSAMFGSEHGTQPYESPDDGRLYHLAVKRGPDSVRQERLRLPYWFEGPQHESLYAGLSPFALTRLCRETGGAYLIKDHEASRSPFALETMRPYVPEYDSPSEYMRQVASHPLRQAVLRAVDVSYQRQFRETPQLSFAPTGTNFQKQLVEAQKLVATNAPLLDEALAPFGPKGMEPAYEAETSPRWRAWYDLTLGRLLAMRVRNNEYNWACAVMKGKGANFVDTQSNRWQFQPSPKLNFGTASEKQAAEALRLLKRCVENNPGTPWALLAQRELDHPLGFTVEEAYVAPPPPPAPRPVTPTVRPPRPNPNMPRRPMDRPLVLPRPVVPNLPKL